MREVYQEIRNKADMGYYLYIYIYISGVILKGDLGEKVSLSWLTSISWAEGEVKMYRMYREIQNLDQNFSLKSWNCHKTSPSLKALGWPLYIYIILLLLWFFIITHNYYKLSLKVLCKWCHWYTCDNWQTPVVLACSGVQYTGVIKQITSVVFGFFTPLVQTNWL